MSSNLINLGTRTVSVYDQIGNAVQDHVQYTADLTDLYITAHVSMQRHGDVRSASNYRVVSHPAADLLDIDTRTVIHLDGHEIIATPHISGHGRNWLLISATGGHIGTVAERQIRCSAGVMTLWEAVGLPGAPVHRSTPTAAARLLLAAKSAV